MVTPIVLRAPKPTKGTAALVFHYMGDKRLALLAQETVKISKALKGYDKTVLLKFTNELPSWLDLSERDEEAADVVDKPTKANIAKYLKKLTDEGYMIDLFIYGHGSPGSFNVSEGRYGEDEDMTAADIKALPKNAGYTKLPIRMIWSTICYGETLNDEWIAAGAKVVAGSRFVYFYPNMFSKFCTEWNKGDVSYAAALKASNTAAIRTAVQALLLLDSKGHLQQWGGKVWEVNVLGNGEAAEKYFTSKIEGRTWIKQGNWQASMSGKDNMNYSSAKITAGDGKVTKNSVPTW